MRILVTGGAGYIGSHTCKALAIAGHQPVVYDNLRTGHREFIKWGPLVEADLLDGWRLRQALREYRVGAVVHFAASTYVAESMGNPGFYFRNNCVASLELLEAMLECGVPWSVAANQNVRSETDAKAAGEEIAPVLALSPKRVLPEVAIFSLEWAILQEIVLIERRPMNQER